MEIDQKGAEMHKIIRYRRKRQQNVALKKTETSKCRTFLYKLFGNKIEYLHQMSIDCKTIMFDM